MADSWEDQGEDVVLQPTRPRLRADAPAFTFNPGASSFQPPSPDVHAMQQPVFAAPQPPAGSQQARDVPSFQQAAFAPRTAGPPPGFAASPAAAEAAEAGKPEQQPAPEDHQMEDAGSALDDAEMQPESERDPPGEPMSDPSVIIHVLWRLQLAYITPGTPPLLSATSSKASVCVEAVTAPYGSGIEQIARHMIAAMRHRSPACARCLPLQHISWARPSSCMHQPPGCEVATTMA